MTPLHTTSDAYKFARAKLGDHRKLFDSVPDALAALRAIYASESFPADFPVLVARVGQIDLTADDSIPPLTEWPADAQAAFTAPGVKVGVTFLGVRNLPDPTDATGKKRVNGARAFVVYPLFDLASIRAESSGDAWLWKVIEKEASHVALRGLRNVGEELGVDALVAAALAMPATVADYVEESTSEALDTTAFDAIWKTFKALLAGHPGTAALAQALPPKAELIRAIRNKAYAEYAYPELEANGAFVFVGSRIADTVDYARNIAIQKGEEPEYDSAEIRGWVETRAEKSYTPPVKKPVDLSSLDFASFVLPTTAPTATGQ